jgi:hypothetical protein
LYREISEVGWKELFGLWYHLRDKASILSRPNPMSRLRKIHEFHAYIPCSRVVEYLQLPKMAQ